MVQMCDIATLLLAANLYLSSTGSFGITLVDTYAVCGCECLRGSEMYECIAEEERDREKLIKEIRKAVESCEEELQKQNEEDTE